jgi:hypothetical protein
MSEQVPERINDDDIDNEELSEDDVKYDMAVKAELGEYVPDVLPNVDDDGNTVP